MIFLNIILIIVNVNKILLLIKFVWLLMLTELRQIKFCVDTIRYLILAVVTAKILIRINGGQKVIVMFLAFSLKFRTNFC